MDSFEELKKKVDAYPNSSLFVPLAEEYKKRGELDEAINVLKRGLERQPSYISARTALAKVFLAKGMRAEAIDELEIVVKAAPDNFLAHKKLADTYCKLGRREDAEAQYNIVLTFNPEDEEAIVALRKIQSGECLVEDEGVPDAPPSDKQAPPVAGGVGADAPAGKPQANAAQQDDAEAFDSEEFVQQTEYFKEGNEAVVDTGEQQETPVDELEGDEVSFEDLDESDFDVFEEPGYDMAEEPEEDESYSVSEDADYSMPVGEGMDEAVEEDETYSVSEDADMDIGGLEFEPDGIYGDEDAGDVVHRDEEAGLELAADEYADAQQPQQWEGAQHEDHGDEIDILTAAEEVGREVFNEPSAEEGAEDDLYVPSGGDDTLYSGEYSTESLVEVPDEDAYVAPAPGLETFEDEYEEPAAPSADKTVIMREPLAGMEEDARDAGYEETTMMEAPAFEEPAVAAEAGYEETTMMEAPAFEEPAVVAEAGYEETTMMEAPAFEEPAVAAEAEYEETTMMEAPAFEEPAVVAEAEYEETTMMEAPAFEEPAVVAEAEYEETTMMEAPAFEETAMAVEAVGEEPIIAEPGTIADGFGEEDATLINDPFSPGMSVAEEGVAPVEAMPVEAEPVETVSQAAPAAAPAVDLMGEINNAELLVASGEYTGAIQAYSALISRYPGDNIVRMKMDELKMLLKLTGQGSVMYQMRLESYLAAIMRRKDELRKST